MGKKNVSSYFLSLFQSRIHVTNDTLGNSRSFLSPEEDYLCVHCFCGKDIIISVVNIKITVELSSPELQSV